MMEDCVTGIQGEITGLDVCMDVNGNESFFSTLLLSLVFGTGGSSRD